MLLVRHAATSATRAAAFPADEPIEDGAAALAAPLAALVRGRDAAPAASDARPGHGAAASEPTASGARPGRGMGAANLAAPGARPGREVGAAGPTAPDARPGQGAAAGEPAATGSRPRFDLLASPALRCRQTAAAAGLTARPEPRIAECDFAAWAGRTLASVHAEQPDAVGAWMADPDAAPHGGESLRAFAARVGGWLDEQAGEDGTTLAITHGGVIKAALVHALGAPLDAFWRLDVAPLSVTELHAHDGRWTVTRTNCPLDPAVGRARSAAVAQERGAAGSGGTAVGGAPMAGASGARVAVGSGAAVGGAPMAGASGARVDVGGGAAVGGAPPAGASAARVAGAGAGAAR
nr:histidine phosphatase family protein [Conexibacter arvalis]